MPRARRGAKIREKGRAQAVGADPSPFQKRWILPLHLLLRVERTAVALEVPMQQIEKTK
jgi:hypothetical protein